MRTAVFITPERLAAELRWRKPPVVLDVRWSLQEPDGLPAYRAGHIPGAAYVDLETELSARPSPERGRHPLPDIAHLQAAARSWGLNDGDAVVCYDDFDGAATARAWWLLKWGGVESVRILDGGFRAWAGHGDIVTGSPQPRRRKDRGNISLTPGHLPTLTADEIAEFSGVVLDARAPARYRGEYEPFDARAGHIPGAVNAPYTASVYAGGLLPERELRNRFSALGALDGDPVAVYCGSGVTATHNAAALASLGVEAALYPGSWSQWAADRSRPAALVN